MTVQLEHRDNGVAVLTLDDPARRNAMTEAMGDALAARCAELASDQRLRAVVLTGSPPAFSGGGDLEMLEELSRRTREEGYDATATMAGFYRRFLSVRELPVPVIAAINGHAVGAGLCIALACELRLVADEAT
ncbi:MAG: enoyl-CoA hydratase/isomerase family protein, partial [Nitriliruptoraceae bacterium]